jgi:Delta7-sterol 5-desaturase
MNFWNSVLEGTGWMSLRLLAVLVGALIVQAHAGLQRFRIVQRAISERQVQRELLTAAGLTLLDAVVFVVVHHLDGLRFRPAGVLSFVVTFAAIFGWFEVAYYVVHRLLHTRALYFIHRRHHEATTAHPFTGFAFSGSERLLQTFVGLGGIALASRVWAVDQVALETYLVLSYVVNFLAHSNLELASPSFARTGWGQVFITTTYHALHHTRFRGHYGLYTVVLDRLCGTAFSDYAAVQQRAAEGAEAERPFPSPLTHQSRQSSLDASPVGERGVAVHAVARSLETWR